MASERPGAAPKPNGNPGSGSKPLSGNQNKSLPSASNSALKVESAKAESAPKYETGPYAKVVDIGGDCYFLEDDQTSLKMGCKSYVEFKKTFDQNLYKRPLKDIEYIFGRYLAFGKQQLDTFSENDKVDLTHLLTTRITQLKESSEYSSSRIINSRMRTYVDNINAILAKLGEAKEVPNNVGKAETFADEQLYQFILELTWFMTHADKVPKQNRKLWNEMIKKMQDLRIQDIAEQIRTLNTSNSKSNSPPKPNSFFAGVETTKMKDAKTLRQAVGDLDTDLRPKFDSLMMLLRAKGYLEQDQVYNASMQETLSKKMLNTRVVQDPARRTGVQMYPATHAPASAASLISTASASAVAVARTGVPRQVSAAPQPSSSSTVVVAAPATAASTSSSTASTSQPSPTLIISGSAAPAASGSGSGSQSSTALVSAAPAASASAAQSSSAASQFSPLMPLQEEEHSPGVIGEQGGSNNIPQGESQAEGQPRQDGGNMTLTNESNDLNTDTLYQLTSPLFDYIRVLFDPIYSILQRPEFEKKIALITIIPLLHACMNIKLPGIYRIKNIDPEVKEFIDTMLGATKEFISTLSPKSKEQFLEQLKKLPRMHLTSLLGSSSNSNHYKDPSTFPAIQFLSLGVNFTVNEEKKDELDSFFDEECLYLSNTQETSTTNKLKEVFSSNSNKKIKLYTLDWNTIKASKASLDLQNDKKEINPDTLEINPEVIFNDSELFLKTIMIVHHIFPGKNTFTPIEQPEPTPKAEPEAEPKEEPKEEESEAESTCKVDLVAQECTGTPSERKKQYRKQTVLLHPDKHSTDGCEKEATAAFKDLQSKKSCTKTNENTVAPSNTVVVPTTNTPVIAPTTNAVVAPTTNAPLALTANSVPTTTNIVIVPTK
jgi:hypothetical protein